MLRLLLSPSYRQAVAAEAAGEYLAAARAYAVCGQRHKVAEMQLLEAERLGAGQSAESVEGRLSALRAAAHWADEGSAEGRALLARIGRAYLQMLRRGFLLGRDAQIYEEAARLLLRGGDPAGAGEVYELGGQIQAAADAYKEAGEIERVEALLAGEERRRRSEGEERDHFAAYQHHMLLGRRDEAQAALRACLGAARDKQEPQRLLDELAARLLTDGRVTLRRRPLEPAEAEWGPPVRYVGRFPLILGRGDDCALALRDPGVSRGHASIGAGPALPGAAPTFTLRDLGSRNGTTLGGLALGGELPLRGEGEIGIGEACALRFRVERARLELEVTRGLARGTRLVGSPGPIALGEGAELRFQGGRPHLHASSAILLNERRAPAAVQLLRGDVLEAGGARFEVLE